MKILYLIDSLGAGGAERSTYRLAHHLEEMGHATAIVALKPKAVGISEEYYQLQGRVVVADTTSLRGRLDFVRRTILEENPDIVHSVILDSNLALRIIGWYTQGFVTVQSLVGLPYLAERRFSSRSRTLKHAVVKQIDVWSARFSDIHYHVISEAVADHYRSVYRYDDDRVSLVYRGRDANPLVEGPRSFPTHRPFRVINVGRQEEVKDQVTAVRAMHYLVHERGVTDIHQRIYGRQGKSTKLLERTIRELDLGNYVELVGFEPAMDRAYAEADAFLFPSLHEGMGGALVEAMAAALPCICSDIPTFHEVVGDDTGGLFFPVGDAAAAGRCILEAYQDKSRYEQLSAHAHQRFTAAFRNERVLTQMIDLYQRALAHEA